MSKLTFLAKHILNTSSKLLVKPTFFQPQTFQPQTFQPILAKNFSLTSTRYESPNLKETPLAELLEKIKSSSKSIYKLIDVREKEERAQGAIPTSNWIPLGEFESALKLDNKSFEAKYKFPKLKKDDSIILHCRSGVRSGKAQLIAQQHGYQNVSNYKGSWNEFSSLHPELISFDDKISK